jgi:hypothetical protein
MKTEVNDNLSGGPSWRFFVGEWQGFSGSGLPRWLIPIISLR